MHLLHPAAAVVPVACAEPTAAGLAEEPPPVAAADAAALLAAAVVAAGVDAAPDPFAVVMQIVVATMSFLPLLYVALATAPQQLPV